jgi:hypothetical protein
MSAILGSAIVGMGTALIDRLFPDKEKADQAKIQLISMMQNGELQELAARTGVIQAEANSEHWLAATWRPVTMLVFVGLITARWFGWAAPNLSEAEYLKLWSIVEFGLGGYVVGRSGEKIIPQIAAILAKK